MINLELERLRQITEVKKRRLHELQLLQAGKGSTTEPHVVMEIEDLHVEVSELEGRIAVLARSSSPVGEPDVQPLLSPLAKYDEFLRRLFERKSTWSQDRLSFKQKIMSSIAYASRAEWVFIAHSTGATWESMAAKDEDALQQTRDLLSQNAQLRMRLDQSYRHFKNTKIVNPDIFTNTVYSKLESNGKLCVFIVIPDTNPAQILVFYSIRTDFEIDSALATIVNTLLRSTNNLSQYDESLFIESLVYNDLKLRFGYVSDYVYKTQLNLFKERLKSMTVFFEPIIALSRKPYIWRWEALARDPKSRRAPVDLFETAKIWGREFQIELDVHFLHTAVRKYGQFAGTSERDLEKAKDTKTDESRKLVARIEELPPLHINVFPESLIRRHYKDAISQIERYIGFPVGKLVLEISEKSPLPLPGSKVLEEYQVKWFRDELQYYTDQGISFAIDDFGVGYASTSRLSRIEPEFVKIDRDALLHHLGTFTLEYARNLVRESFGKMKMIVEGLDDQSKFTLGQLYELKIQYVQGHLLGRDQEYIYRLEKPDVKRIADLLPP